MLRINKLDHNYSDTTNIHNQQNKTKTSRTENFENESKIVEENSSFQIKSALRWVAFL